MSKANLERSDWWDENDLESKEYKLIWGKIEEDTNLDEISIGKIIWEGFLGTQIIDYAGDLEKRKLFSSNTTSLLLYIILVSAKHL